jgi:hypothetical protein
MTQQQQRRKGGFKRDGSTHYSGIKNEHSIADILNTATSTIGAHIRPIPVLQVKHMGGTHTKADAVVINTVSNEVVKTISIKNHKKTGTFDWLNSTASLPEEMKAPLKDAAKAIKDAFTTIEESRVAVDKMFCDALDQIKDNDAFLRGLLQSVYEKYTDSIIINCEKDNKLVYFEKDQLLELKCYTDAVYYLKHASGTCSAQIMRRSTSGEEINTHLRIRLVLNNGVNALVGQSAKNKSSVPCIKIQQDNVDYLISTLTESIVETMVGKSTVCEESTVVLEESLVALVALVTLENSVTL